MKIKDLEKRDFVVFSLIAIASFVSIGLLASLDQFLDNPYLIASFGATAVLIYGAPDAPFSKPRNVFFGHLFSAIIGVTVSFIFVKCGYMEELRWLACAISVSLAIIVMKITNTVHPPGGATALTCAMCGFATVEYIIRPIMLGIIVMMIIAYAVNILRGCLITDISEPNGQ